LGDSSEGKDCRKVLSGERTEEKAAWKKKQRKVGRKNVRNRVQEKKERAKTALQEEKEK
jgi:hypothetical protein